MFCQTGSPDPELVQIQLMPCVYVTDQWSALIVGQITQTLSVDIYGSPIEIQWGSRKYPG